ncbi:MAG: hypothetical protein SNF33_06460 [Candidatus Algichlamydia australiensis]|nr:hypothetical protein [Chlamydiales bacterium]
MNELRKYTEMQNPCVANCGHTYEDEKLNELIEQGKDCSFCGVPLQTSTPNLALIEIVKHQENQELYEDPDELYRSVEEVRRCVNFILETQHFFAINRNEIIRNKRIHSERYVEFKSDSGIFRSYPDLQLDTWIKNTIVKREENKKESEDVLAPINAQYGCCIIQ